MAEGTQQGVRASCRRSAWSAHRCGSAERAVPCRARLTSPRHLPVVIRAGHGPGVSPRASLDDRPHGEQGDDGHDLEAEHEPVDVDGRLPAHLPPGSRTPRRAEPRSRTRTRSQSPRPAAPRPSRHRRRRPGAPRGRARRRPAPPAARTPAPPGRLSRAPVAPARSWPPPFRRLTADARRAVMPPAWRGPGGEAQGPKVPISAPPAIAITVAGAATMAQDPRWLATTEQQHSRREGSGDDRHLLRVECHRARHPLPAWKTSAVT